MRSIPCESHGGSDQESFVLRSRKYVDRTMPLR